MMIQMCKDDLTPCHMFYLGADANREAALVSIGQCSVSNTNKNERTLRWLERGSRLRYAIRELAGDLFVYGAGMASFHPFSTQRSMWLENDQVEMLTSHGKSNGMSSSLDGFSARGW